MSRLAKVLAITLPTVLFLMTLIGGYLLGWYWTGFGEYLAPATTPTQTLERAKTLWDWLELLIVPTVLAIAALLFNQSQRAAQTRLTADRQQQELLMVYLDRMSELLLSEPKTDPVHVNVGLRRSVARARTHTVLSELDGRRKGIVLTFLYESRLIDRESSFVCLSRTDLSKANLYKSDLRRANLRQANLSEAFLRKVNMFETSLTGARLSHSNLIGASLYRSSLVLADLSDARLTSADLSEADLSGASLVSARLVRANLERAILVGTNLSGADLSYANLSGSDLSGANLQGADLSHCDLSNAYLFGATLADAKLRGAKLHEAVLINADISQTCITPAVLQAENVIR